MHHNLGGRRLVEITWDTEQFLFHIQPQDSCPQSWKGATIQFTGREKSKEQVSHHKLADQKLPSFRAYESSSAMVWSFACSEQATITTQVGRQNREGGVSEDPPREHLSHHPRSCTPRAFILTKFSASWCFRAAVLPGLVASATWGVYNPVFFNNFTAYLVYSVRPWILSCDDPRNSLSGSRSFS